MADREKHPQSSPPGQDYISSLPNTLTEHIISFLTIEDAVKTSVLSKQWRSTWTSSPQIILCFPENRKLQLHSFIHFVKSVLSSCTATEVKRFVFDSADHSFLDSIVEECLEFVKGHGVQELSLNLHCQWFMAYVLPPYFFQLTTLVSLQLSGCNFWLMDAVNWSSLKTLSIGNARLNNAALRKLLNGCPVLEFLELKECQGSKLVSVESRGLRELVIDSPKLLSRDGSILNIRAPHILKLRLLGNNTSVGFRLDQVISLVESELNFSMKISGPNNAKAHADLVKGLLERLRHVKRLIIGSWCLQVLSLTEARVFLPSLECRHLTFHVAEDHEGVPSIVKILESSPSLEKLFIQMTCTCSSATKFIAKNVEHRNLDAEEFWNSANQRIYQCLMHLKNVEIIDPGADWLAWEPVRSLLEFLLQNVPWLDKIEINSNNSKLSKADDMARIILLHPKRSPSLKVIHSYPSQGCSSKSVHNA